jgi:hypothetical protein
MVKPAVRKLTEFALLLPGSITSPMVHGNPAKSEGLGYVNLHLSDSPYSLAPQWKSAL